MMKQGAVWWGLDKMQYDRTDIEEMLANALQDRGISFLEQHPTRSGFVLDFVIAPNIVLEADGPCHDGSKNRRRDRFRDRILKNEGWNVFRLSYQLINNSNLLKNKLDEILYNKH